MQFILSIFKVELSKADTPFEADLSVRFIIKKGLNFLNSLSTILRSSILYRKNNSQFFFPNLILF